VTILQSASAATPMTHDTLSLSMFLAGALMAFTPLICAAAVLAVWWRQRARAGGETPDAEDRPSRVDR
jgi:hypothetical protein